MSKLSKNNEFQSRKVEPKKANFQSPFNTLEITSEFDEEKLDLSGSGNNSKINLSKRAKSKFLNTRLCLKLADLQSELKDKYWDTYYCSHVIEIVDGKAKSKFCKTRWCIICNRIRTAELIQKYFPTVQSWENKHFMTLTVKNCSKEKLGSTIKKMHSAFAKIKDLMRKQGKKLVGIRKLEITYNRFTNEFHPHYHLVTENGDNCERIIELWLNQFKTAQRIAQDFRPADENSVFELFKYFTKLTSNSSKDKTLTVSALDHIFITLQGIRTFQPFGFVAHKEQKPPEDQNLSKLAEAQKAVESEFYTYQHKLADWLDQESGETLTNFEITSREKNFTKNIRK